MPVREVIRLKCLGSEDDNSGLMTLNVRCCRRLPRMVALLGLVGAILLGALTATARAATVDFTGQFSPTSLPEGTSFSLDGDQVTSFSAMLRPTACASPSDWQSDSDAVFQLALAPGAAVELTNGSFSYTGSATSADYGGGSAGESYGGQFTIAGKVNPAHTFVTATVSLSNAQDPFVSGCSGSYSFIAIPTVTATRTTPDKAAYQSQFLSFDYADGVVRKLQVQANFQCGQSVDSATVNATAYGYPTLQTTKSGVFRLQLYVLDEYQKLVSLTITGRITGKKAGGRIVVDEPPGGFTGVAGDNCSGNHGWTASKPVPPPAPGPAAYFQWAAIRVPTGTTWRYYFATNDLSCTDHANEVLVTIAHRTITVPCSKPAAFASGPLTPSTAYSVRSQAVHASHGRIVKRGAAVTVPVKMPGAGDLWTVISNLPGTPPS